MMSCAGKLVSKPQLIDAAGTAVVIKYIFDAAIEYYIREVSYFGHVFSGSSRVIQESL
jgi:hypothetical protein